MGLNPARDMDLFTHMSVLCCPVLINYFKMFDCCKRPIIIVATLHRPCFIVARAYRCTHINKNL
jgi:hypothetical protein